MKLGNRSSSDPDFTSLNVIFSPTLRFLQRSCRHSDSLLVSLEWETENWSILMVVERSSVTLRNSWVAWLNVLLMGTTNLTYCSAFWLCGKIDRNTKSEAIIHGRVASYYWKDCFVWWSLSERQETSKYVDQSLWAWAKDHMKRDKQRKQGYCEGNAHTLLPEWWKKTVVGLMLCLKKCLNFAHLS